MKVLDCTLRDGAYIVNSKFGDNNIREIISALSLAGIDIIECGWLRDCVHEKDSVFYSVPDDLAEYLPSKKSELALMFDYGRYDIKKLPQNNGLVDIIRLAFYKKSLDEISFTAECVKNKGYKVYLQPSNILEYSEFEMHKLCSRANHIGVDAIYIVDSFGSMFPEDLDKILPIFEEVSDMQIGFHSHNSIQMSLALTIKFIKFMKGRNISVDASLAGIGRGAGNTKTELLLEYLNRNGYGYDTDVIYSCLDKNIIPFYENFNWEYTPDKGYRGIHGLHPNAPLNN